MIVLLCLVLSRRFRSAQRPIGLAAIYLICCTANAQAEKKRPVDPYEEIGPIRDRIVSDYARATLASEAFFCRFRSLDWMSERNNILHRDALLAAQINGLAYSIKVENENAFNAWYQAAGTAGVPASDCINLRDSQALRDLDALRGATTLK